ncbi:MAG: hypothetical protein ACT4N4_07145 [Rhodospirillales bacterium]
MSEAEAKRRLSTILSADVAAFDRLKAAGEGEARARLAAAMDALAQRIAAHDGAVLSAAGGSLVASFDSPVEAVRCALATQRAMAEEEEDAAPDRRLLFRLDVDLGVDLGDGGGPSARGAEAAVEPGHVLVSGAVREQILGKIDLDAEGVDVSRHGAAWTIAPPRPGQVPTIPIPAAKPAPPPDREAFAEDRRFPLLRLSLAAAALAAAAAAYLALLRTGPLPEAPESTLAAPAPPAAPGRVAGPTLPGRPFAAEQVPFVDAADRARLRAEYMPAAPHKAIAISRGNASFWYVQGAASAGAAGEAAVDSCRRNAPEPCELYALGNDLVWERPLPSVPPRPWIAPEGERLETPFDPARVPLTGPAMRQLLQAEYAPRRPFKALALARSGTVGFATRRPTPDDAMRAALEQCGDLTGTVCAVVALDDRFVAAIPETMRVTGLFRPEPLPPFAAPDYKRLAEQYLPLGGWKAVALGRAGRMGLAAGHASEQAAIDAALADCRAAKPPSAGPGGVAAAVLGNMPPDCAVYALGIFTVEAK